MKHALPPIDQTRGAIGENIERIRKQKGFTQIQLAENIGIAQALISKYENGNLQLSGEMIIRFAIALEVSTDKILGLDAEAFDSAPSLKIMRRLKKIEELSDSDQKALLKTIDKFIS